MTATQETTLSPEAIEMLKAAFKALKPEEKKQVISRVASNITVTIGFRTSESGVFAIPLASARRDLPPSFADVLLQVVPQTEFTYVDVPANIIPKNPCTGVEWYGFLEASKAAIPRGNMKGDLEAYIASMVPAHKEVLSRAALQAILSVIESMTDTELSGKEYVAASQKVIRAFLQNTPDRLIDHPAYSEIMYALDDFVTMYLCDVDSKNHQYIIRSAQVATLR